jgi:hypothetical protein
VTDALRKILRTHCDPRFFEALAALPRSTGAATLTD